MSKHLLLIHNFDDRAVKVLFNLVIEREVRFTPFLEPLSKMEFVSYNI